MLIVGAAVPPQLLEADFEHLGINATDTAPTAAVTSEATERMTRYRRLHERGLYEAMHHLRLVQQDRLREPAAPTIAVQFSDEASCTQHLAARIGSPEWRCPQCGDPHGYWLAARGRWECSGCQTQIGPRRHGHGRLALAAGHLVFGHCLRHRRPVDLGNRLGKRDRDPARGDGARHAQQILAALASPDADRLLAGLQRPGTGPRRPESGGASGTIPAKQTSHFGQRTLSRRRYGK